MESNASVFIKLTFGMLCVGMCLCTIPATAQQGTEIIYKEAENPPAPQGGLVAFYEYTEDNLVRPDEAKKKGVKGCVFVRFVVEKDGKLSNIEIVKGIGSGCDEAVVKCLKTAPKWVPGKQQGKPVRVQKTMAIQVR
jgi:periplasmic protein TonB